MSSVITTLGKTRMNELAGEETGLVIDRMVLAMVPGLDTSAAADPDQQLPAEEHIVYTYEIPDDYKGYVNTDQVVYSMMLGSDIGEFSFNWIGLLEKDTDTVITVTVTPESSKWATDLATNTTGNMVTRNVILSYQDAQNLTGITIAAETWQFDYQGDFNTHLASIVDPTQEGSNPKHVTDSQAKKWEDHVDDTQNAGVHDKLEWGYSRVKTEVDLNALRTGGRFYCVSCNNTPTGNDGYLINNVGSANDCMQVFRTNAITGKVFCRVLIDDAWGGWYEISDNRHVHRYAQLGSRETPGDWTLTGLKYEQLVIFGGVFSSYGRVQFRIKSGGKWGVTNAGEWMRMEVGDSATITTPGSFTVVANASTMEIEVGAVSGCTLYAYTMAGHIE